LEGIVGRLGGEEFGIIVEAAVSDAMKTLETFRRTIGGLKIHADNTVVEVTCSLGLAEWEVGDTVDGLLRRADMALYEAKRKGRNRVVAADTFAISKNHENWQGVARQIQRSDRSPRSEIHNDREESNDEDRNLAAAASN
jgi:predicted signal transduction protein with EAL and GGDEF domain